MQRGQALVQQQGVGPAQAALPSPDTPEAGRFLVQGAEMVGLHLAGRSGLQQALIVAESHKAVTDPGAAGGQDLVDQVGVLVLAMDIFHGDVHGLDKPVRPLADDEHPAQVQEVLFQAAERVAQFVVVPGAAAAQGIDDVDHDVGGSPMGCLNEDLPEPGDEKTKKARRRNRFRRRACVDTRGSMPQALSVPSSCWLAVQLRRSGRLSKLLYSMPDAALRN
mgnify:CR=1 FL=1